MSSRFDRRFFITRAGKAFRNCAARERHVKVIQFYYHYAKKKKNMLNSRFPHRPVSHTQN